MVADGIGSGGTLVTQVRDDEGCGGDVADAAGVEANVAQGLESGLEREFPRSPMARGAVYARCSSASWLPGRRLTVVLVLA
jgi:hypothetical protein